LVNVMSSQLKIFLVMLLGVALPLSACSSQRSHRADASGTAFANPSPVPHSSLTISSERSSAQPIRDRVQTQRQNYKPISLAEIAPNTLIGNDPKTVALAAFGNIESEGGSREVKVNYPQRDRAIVTITQTGVADDSIGGIRYRVELEKNQSAPAGKQWKIVWAGSQVKCQPQRGHQDWSTELCL
jgi:hypothetical protein